MKKILIGCCAAALAVAANAASVKWSMGNGVLSPSPDGSAMSGRASYYTMLVFDAASADAVTAALSTLDYSALSSTALDSYQAKKVGLFSSVVNGLTGDSATLFAVIFDTAEGETISQAGYYYVTGKVTQSTYDPSGSDPATVAAFTAAQMTGTWTAAGAVPEPTSGLLLALGLCGLALRRKRA